MNKILKITLTFVLIVALLCAVSSTFAATTDELIAFASKTFTVAGKSMKLSDQNLKVVKDYLAKNTVSEADADKIIAKVNEGVALVNATGVKDVKDLSQAKKDELLKLAQEAATIAGAASFSYNKTDKQITITDKAGNQYVASVASEFQRTGADYTAVVVAGVAIIAIAAVVGYRKFRVNA